MAARLQQRKEGVTHTVEIVKKHPLLPPNIPVHGLLIDSTTGELEIVVNGSEENSHS